MNYWILQSNPKYFRILKWLRDFTSLWLGDKPLLDCWHISQFEDEVKPDDTVFVWKSKGNEDVRGIYAKGKVKPLPPGKFPLEDREADYFVGEKGKAEKERLDSLPPVAVCYTDFYFDEPLLSDVIKEVPELRGLTILKKGPHRRGIHRVESGQGRIIESLLGIAKQQILKGQ